jgi:hypothetical protein
LIEYAAEGCNGKQETCMGTNDNKKIYILISKTSTIPSDIIKLWTREPYAHTSLALDIELKEMYSFARKGIKNPFNCGFISEDITKGIFGRDKNTQCIVLELAVTKRQHELIVKELEKFKKNAKKYRYNYQGIFGVIRKKAIERKYNFFCSQFVASVLKNAGVNIIEKAPGLVRPEDFRKCEKLNVIYTGLLADYREFLKKKFYDIEELKKAE